MNTDQITVGMEQLINSKVTEILAAKPRLQQYLNWRDMQEVCLAVKSDCIKLFGRIPKGVEMACCFAEAVLAPDKKDKVKLIKKACSLTSGVAGLSMIIAGVSTALGWGCGIAGIMLVFFGGMFFPLAIVGAGVTVTIIAGYFFFNDGAKTLSDKAIAVLTQGVRAALVEYAKQQEKQKEKQLPE